MKIEEMEMYIDAQHERVEVGQEEMEELNRRVRSQQETLEELVRKNLEMEMELNVKKF